MAHKVTKSSERKRRSHTCTFIGVPSPVRAGGRGESVGMECGSFEVVAGGVVGSTLNTHSSPGPRDGRLIQTHLSILRPEGLDALGNVAIVDVAAVDLKEIA